MTGAIPQHTLVLQQDPGFEKGNGGCRNVARPVRSLGGALQYPVRPFVQLPQKKRSAATVQSEASPLCPPINATGFTHDPDR